MTNVSWPEDCKWPAPVEERFDNCGDSYDEDLIPVAVNDDIQDLIDIKDYFDTLVEEGRLDEDYLLNADDIDDDEEWEPEKGEEYWYDDHFDIDSWREDLTDRLNEIKLHDPRITYGPDCDHYQILMSDPSYVIRQTIHYDFINENLLRQAFTRRSFAVEHELKGYSKRDGCSEELEFLGDSIMNAIVTKEIIRQYSKLNSENTEAPFEIKYDEGELSKIRSHFVSKEYLSSRASALHLDQYILYGSSDQPSDSSREDMVEALIGAVAIDSNWDQDTLEDLVNLLLDLQLNEPDELLKKSYYEILNSWHQSHFGRIPEYEIDPQYDHLQITGYSCLIKFMVPKNNKDVWTSQNIQRNAETRSKAREKAAHAAYDFIVSNGLWMNLSQADITPDKEHSINQLQELYQKKYISEPEYSFSKNHSTWKADCICSNLTTSGYGKNKTDAKKTAAYSMIIRLLSSAGCCKEEWKKDAVSDWFKSLEETSS